MKPWLLDKSVSCCYVPRTSSYLQTPSLLKTTQDQKWNFPLQDILYLIFSMSFTCHIVMKYQHHVEDRAKSHVEDIPRGHDISFKISLWGHQSSIGNAVTQHINPVYEMQKQKVCFNPGWPPQLQLHYQTIWIQVDQLHCWSTIGLLCNFRHADG